MKALDNGWFYDHGYFNGGEEGSKGEGLSRFLAVQIKIANGLGNAPVLGFGITPLWLNPPWTNGVRQDFVDNNPDNNKASPVTGCTTLFLYYLHNQLGKSINSIIKAGSSNLAGVYQNLTGSNQPSDAWNDFSSLVNSHYPTGTVYQLASDNLFPVSDLFVLILPNDLTCGYSATADISVNNPAMAEIVVQLSSGDLLTVPATVTIPLGSQSRSFSVHSIAQSLPFNSKSAQITATYANKTISATLTVISPQVASLRVTPGDIICGNGASGTVTLNSPSLKGPATVAITSSDPDLQVPPTVLIAENMPSSSPFAITTSNITAGFLPRKVTTTAALGGKTVSFVVHIVSPTVASLTLSPDSVACGSSCTGVVTLDRVSFLGNVVVDLTWQPNSFPGIIPSQVTIPPGSISSEPFTINAPSTIPSFAPVPYQGLLYASYAGTDVSAWLTVTSSAGIGVLSSLTLQPSTIVGGGISSGTVTLEKAVGSPTEVGLAAFPTVRVKPGSDIPLPHASLPSSVTVPAGETSAIFVITTKPLVPAESDRTIGIAASAGGVTKTELLTLTY